MNVIVGGAPSDGTHVGLAVVGRMILWILPLLFAQRATPR
uniref:Uncharacterized protein n=1 Tax=Rhizophora mucronata TaxID=61149 RepID=A0A2P2PM39_RHIMU